MIILLANLGVIHLQAATTDNELFDLATYVDKGKKVGFMDQVRAWQKDTKEQGGLMLQAQAAMALEISTPRISELVTEGTFQRFTHFKKHLLSANQVVAWGKLQKCSGPKGAHIKALFVSSRDDVKK